MSFACLAFLDKSELDQYYDMAVGQRPLASLLGCNQVSHVYVHLGWLPQLCVMVENILILNMDVQK